MALKIIKSQIKNNNTIGLTYRKSTKTLAKPSTVTRPYTGRRYSLEHSLSLKVESFSGVMRI